MVTQETRDEAKKLAKKLEQHAKPNAEAKIKYGAWHKRVDAAKRYAAADPSDPFAYKRAMTHLSNGIAGFRPDGRDAFYDAEANGGNRVRP